MTGPIEIRKLTAYMPISIDMLLDVGAITEEQARAQGWAPRPPAPPLSLRRRTRARWWAWRSRVGRAVGSWIAGENLSDRDDE